MFLIFVSKEAVRPSEFSSYLETPFSLFTAKYGALFREFNREGLKRLCMNTFWTFTQKILIKLGSSNDMIFLLECQRIFTAYFKTFNILYGKQRRICQDERILLYIYLNED